MKSKRRVYVYIYLCICLQVAVNVAVQCSSDGVKRVDDVEVKCDDNNRWQGEHAMDS